jgi:hypothetical protein
MMSANVHTVMGDTREIQQKTREIISQPEARRVGRIVVLIVVFYWSGPVCSGTLTGIEVFELPLV